jgi:hypothetical protein
MGGENEQEHCWYNYRAYCSNNTLLITQCNYLLGSLGVRRWDKFNHALRSRFTLLCCKLFELWIDANIFACR